MINKNNLINYNQAEHKTNENDVKKAKIRCDGVVTIVKCIFDFIYKVINAIIKALVLVFIVFIFSYQPPRLSFQQTPPLQRSYSSSPQTS